MFLRYMPRALLNIFLLDVKDNRIVKISLLDSKEQNVSWSLKGSDERNGPAMFSKSKIKDLKPLSTGHGSHSTRIFGGV